MPHASAEDTLELLSRWSTGDKEALNRLMPLVYGELRRLASSFLRQERVNHTLETSALVHEAFLRLFGQDSIQCEHRRQFFTIAARTMRRILVEHARHRKTLKCGGDACRLSLDQAPAAGVALNPALVDLDEALTALADVSVEQAQVVELRYFGGLRAEEISDVIGLSIPTVTRRWRAARAWLFRYLECNH
jgi:RNA polymerase sigma factor (TIGR02999 family)